ncbi:MAG: peptidoglycan-binding domain-containing protein, partial [Planctomycetota bacterium]
MKHIDRYILSERAKLPREAAKIILENPELLGKTEKEESLQSEVWDKVLQWGPAAYELVKGVFGGDDDDKKKDDDDKKKDDDGFDPLSVLSGDKKDDDDVFEQLPRREGETISSGNNQEVIIEPDGTIRVIRGGGAGRGRGDRQPRDGGDREEREEKEESTSVTGGLIAIGIALLVALGLRYGFRKAASLDNSNAIGGPKYFQHVGLTPNYPMLKARVRHWALNKGERPRLWELMDRTSIRTFTSRVLLNQELWKRVHARQNDINNKATGGKGGFFGGIFSDFKEEFLEENQITQEVSIPGFSDDDDGVLGKIAKARKLQKTLDVDKQMEDLEEQEKHIKMLLNVYNKELKSPYKITEGQLRATMEVIKEEYERLSEELDSEFEELDRWDGSDVGAEMNRYVKVKGRDVLNSVDYFDWFEDVTELERKKAETSDAEVFVQHFLPGLAIVYDKWIHDQLKKKLKETKPAGPKPGVGAPPEEAPEAPAAVAPVAIPKEKTKAQRQAELLEGLGLELSVIQEMLYGAGYFDKPSDKLRTFGYSSRKPLKADNKYGSETETAIMNLQRKLNSRGYSLKVDGLYGPDTHKAYSETPINADGSLPGEAA